jgi:geranylgeranyl diphosphate synthase type I
LDFRELSAWRTRIEAELSRTFAAEKKRAKHAALSDAVDTLAEFTLRGGKRLRALLVLAGYHIASGKSPAPALSAAAALEHFQSWMLIHDDIIDHAEERRGGATIHRTFANRHGTEQLLGSGEDYGTGLGITLGDLEEPFTVDALLRGTAPPARRLRALSEYVRMTQFTAYGQLLDIRNGSLPLDRIRESDVLEVYRLKTAVYTVTSPLRIGAILGGGREKLLRDLEDSGTCLGIAFQLRDDVLGAGFGSEDIGKSANDLIEGKRTLLVVRAWAKADPIGRALLSDVLGRPDAPPEKLRAAQALLRSTGSLAYSEEKIRSLTDEAFHRIDSSRAVPDRSRPLLREIGEKLTQRTA